MLLLFHYQKGPGLNQQEFEKNEKELQNMGLRDKATGWPNQ